MLPHTSLSVLFLCYSAYIEREKDGGDNNHNKIVLYTEQKIKKNSEARMNWFWHCGKK